MCQNVDVHLPEDMSQPRTPESEKWHILFYISTVLYVLIRKFDGPRVLSVANIKLQYLQNATNTMQRFTFYLFL